MTKKQTGQVSVKSLKLNKQPIFVVCTIKLYQTDIGFITAADKAKNQPSFGDYLGTNRAPLKT